MEKINYMKGWKRLFILCSVLWIIYNLYQYPSAFFIPNSAVEAEIKVLLEKEFLNKFNKDEELIVELKSEVDYKKKTDICAYGTERGVLEINNKWTVVNEKSIKKDVCKFDTSEIYKAYETAEHNVLEVRKHQALVDFIRNTLFTILLAYLFFRAIFWVWNGFKVKG